MFIYGSFLFTCANVHLVNVPMKTNEPIEGLCVYSNDASVDSADVKKLIDLLIDKDEQIKKDREQIYKLIRIIENCLKDMPDSACTQCHHRTDVIRNPCKHVPSWWN